MPADAAASSPSVPDLQQRLEVLEAELRACSAERDDAVKELRQRTADLAESRDYQTATSEVLNAMSGSPTGIQPVFTAIAESAARFCRVEFCHLYRFDGELVHFMASFGSRPEVVAAIRSRYPLPPSRRSCAARAIL